jgi:hypothetical protein
MYDLLSDAIYWSDELPSRDVLYRFDNWEVVRFVLRYRTTLSLGSPEEEYRCYYEKSKELFPNWPGFLPERCGRENSYKYNNINRSLNDNF